MAEKAPSPFIKDRSGIAIAVGLPLPPPSNQSARAKKQRTASWATVDGWIAGQNLPAGCAPFPPKITEGKGKGYWRRAEVLAWEQARLALLIPPPAELPAQAKPAEGDLFALKPEQVTEANRARLLRMRAVHLGLAVGDPLKKWEVDELVANGLLPRTAELASGEGVAVEDEIYGGVEGIANAINKEFPGAAVHAVYVSDWLKGKRYPCTRPGVKPMPAPHKSGRHLRSLVFPWYRQYVLPEQSPREMNLGGPTLDNRSRQEKADADLAEMKAEQMRRQVSDKWLETDLVTGFVRGFGIWLNQKQTAFIEDRNGLRAIVSDALREVLAPVVIPAEERENIFSALDAKLLPLLQSSNDDMKRETAANIGDLLRSALTDRASAVARALDE